MHAETVPVRVEDLVRLEQRRDARARGAREELQKRREVLRADALGGQRRVAQAVRVRVHVRGRRSATTTKAREVARGRERGARGGGRVQRVHAPERGAE